MRPKAAAKLAVAITLSVGIVLLGAQAGRTAGQSSPTVTLEAVSGYAGHGFVYAAVHSAGASYPAPTGTHLSPYYAEWVPEPFSGANCPWVWAVYVFDRATNTQINATPANSPNRNYGTTTIVCASPSSTPVGFAPMATASARLDLDLAVSVSPPTSTAGSPSSISASLDAQLTQDMSLYLNMAIEDWHVTSWFFDFGDGQSITVSRDTIRLAMPHTYQAAGQYDARAIASISGQAQAAIYDRYGNPTLIQQGFGLEVGNDALANTRARSVRRYLPPSGVVTVTPSLDSSLLNAAAPGFRHIDALRGRLTSLMVHLLLSAEATIMVDGHTVGRGRSRLSGWRLDGHASDAPVGTGTVPGTVHPVGDLLLLQWNSPDRIDRSQGQDYVVPMTLFIDTGFPDGHQASYAIASSFRVSVNFPAESG